jgi:hypothetical protein
MGEIADMLLDQSLMELLDENDGPYDDEFEPEPGWGAEHLCTIQIVRCKYCGRSGFHWEKIENHDWRLHSKTGRVHTCTAYNERDL